MPACFVFVMHSRRRPRGMMRKWIVAVGIALVALLLAFLIALHVMAPKLRAEARQETQD
jgi:hypothetical protein